MYVKHLAGRHSGASANYDILDILYVECVYLQWIL